MKFMLRTSKTLLLIQAAITFSSRHCWAGPPPPPEVVAPLGGPEAAIATTVVIAAYGIWKASR